MHRFALALFTALTLGLSAHARGPTDDCLRTKVWDTYGEGWSVRASTEVELEFGKTRFYKVTMLKGRAYRVVTCAEDQVKNLDVLLYDKDGAVLARDQTTDREPVLAFTPEKTGVYYVVLYLRDLENRDAHAGASWALLHSDS